MEGCVPGLAREAVTRSRLSFLAFASAQPHGAALPLRPPSHGHAALCRNAVLCFASLTAADMHKWAMLNLAFQAGFIFGFFVAIFPYCSYGLPEWTCLPLGAAAPIAVAAVWPCIVHFSWMRAFIKALLSGGIKEFSKNNHKWDGPYKPKVAGKKA